MAGDPLKKVKVGEQLRIPASAYNAFVDTANAFKRSQDGRGGAELVLPPARGGTILVKNDSGEDRDRFDILGLGDPLFAPEDNLFEFCDAVAFSGHTPDVGDAGRFCVLQEPIPVGQCGRAMVSGVTPVQILINADWHRLCDIDVGNCDYLTSGLTGSASIYSDFATGAPVWCYARLGNGKILSQWKNTTGGDCPAYGCFRVTGCDSNLVYSGDRPNTYGSQYRHFFNGPSIVGANKTGTFSPDFPAIAAYDHTDGTPGGGERWGPRNGTWLLKKNTGGFLINGVVDSDNYYASVLRDPFLSFFGQANGSIAKNASGNVRIYAGAPGSETDTGQILGGYNRSAALVLNDPAYGSWVNDQWVIVPAGC